MFYISCYHIIIGVVTPVCEDIDGSESPVVCGIMAVENNGGNISIRSVCDIHTVEID